MNPTYRATFQSLRPAISAPPRPVPPHPRHPRLYPVYYGGYGYYPAYGWYGFGFGFGYSCWFSFFDCYGLLFNYFDTGVSSWHYSPNPQAVMWIYFNDGSALEVTDYWVEGDTFYYILENGHQGNVPVDYIDVDRSTDANSRLGFLFNLNRTRRGTPLDRVELPSFGNPPQPQDQQEPQDQPTSPTLQPQPPSTQTQPNQSPPVARHF